MARISPYFRNAAASVLAGAFLSLGLAITYPAPATAQVEVRYSVSFGYFQGRLARYGEWYHDDRWGDVWRPPHAHRFRPYFDGYWEYTDDYGWMWVSDEPWADITYHYGRWVYDPEEGWLWIPGYVWAPAWVIWRDGDGYLGWFPMPPDYGDFDDGPYYGGRYGFDDCYGYRAWYRMDRESFFDLWIFVDHEHFYRHDYRSYVVAPHAAREVIRRTSDSTRYAMAGDHVVNRSVPNDRIERAMHRSIEAVPARRFIHGDVPVTSPSAGRDIARHEHDRRPDREEGFRGPPHGDDRGRTDHHQDQRPFEQRHGSHGDEGGGGPPHIDRGPGDGGPFGGDSPGRSKHFENAPPQTGLPPPPSEAPSPEHKAHGHQGGGDPPHPFSGPSPGPDRAPHGQQHGNSGGPPQGGGHDHGGGGGKEHGHNPHDDQKDR